MIDFDAHQPLLQIVNIIQVLITITITYRPLYASVAYARTLKAEYLLGLRPQINGSIFDSTGGTLTWITAGRHAGYLSGPSMPHPHDHDLTGQSAFNELVATVRSRRECASE